jgi:uncharacterized membrane protein
VHGGGFYNPQKYRVAPAVLPGTLHWTYLEAYTTFLSGFFLLCVIYYGQAEVYLIDPAVAALTKPQAIVVGIAFLAGGWLSYDGLCRTALARNGRLLGTALALLLSAAAWGLCHLFSGRGAFIEFGAMLGTMMVANVFFVIIPGQRAMVQAKREGREPDPADGARGKLRSTHNTYFTLPVLFAMISNHYAMTYGARYNWAVLIALSGAGAAIRMYFVARHKARNRNGSTAPWPAVAGIVLLAGVAAALAPARPPAVAAVSAGDFLRIQGIVAQRCAVCHAPVPTQPGFSAPPKGVLLDTPEHILALTAAMREQIASHAMPLGNLTGITDEERAAVLAWIDHGAPH